MRYALLIGLNAYPESPLKGCVRDVVEIQKRLEAMSGNISIEIFTASGKSDTDCIASTQDSEEWPSYTNVVACLQKITGIAQAGDFVYIHYSGHGTTIERLDDDARESVRDLALVLLGVPESGEMQYLRGWEMALLLRDMVNKGLIVTLVLDCCFSGSVVRKDPTVRYLEYDASIDAAYPSQLLGTVHHHDGPTYRTASLRENWLLNPDGYTTLTACGPNEVAKELTLKDGGERHGALSYFLLRAFAKLGGVGGNQQQIYHHLCARFRDLREKRLHEQTPMFYGNRDLSFFGLGDTRKRSNCIPVVVNADKSIRLEAGIAHGIAVRDVLELKPLNFDTHSSSSTHTRQYGTITSVEGLTSQLSLVDNSLPRPESGWLAEPVSAYSLAKYVIKLEPWTSHAAVWASYMQHYPWLTFGENLGDEQACALSAAMSSQGCCEVRDDENNLLAAIPLTLNYPEQYVQHVLDILVHLCKFRLVRDMANPLLMDPAHPFNESFEVQLIRGNGRMHFPGCLQLGRGHSHCSHAQCVVEVEEGEKLYLQVENRNLGDTDVLYLHLYSLGHCWEVENMLRGNHEVVVPKAGPGGASGKWRKKMNTVSSTETTKTDQSRYEDTIKIFITSWPTSFASLELPELASSLEGIPANTTRGSAWKGSSNDWAALNFRILTRVK